MLNSDQKKPLDEITGTVENIIFQNSENGYTVIDLFDEKGDLYTAVGVMPYVAAGDTVMLAGRWGSHSSYGKQFEVEYFDRCLPSEGTDILRYLSSGTIKGIGPKTAQKIVGRYGGESFEVIENHPEWLAEFPGITIKKAMEISKNFKEQFGVRDIMLLGKGEISATVALKIFKRYNVRSVDVIRENPYALCEEITGIGFEKCDAFAGILGIERDSIFRIKSGIRYVLNTNAERNGHTYLPEDKLIREASLLLGVSDLKVIQAIETLVTEQKLVRTNIAEDKCIYLDRYYEAERYSAEKLYMLDRSCAGFSLHDKKLLIDRVEIENGITYASLQRKAIESALEHGVMVLTGGPGTGKTTVIRALISIFTSLGQRVALGAPTGRAAKRMSDSTSREAKTIHRLLEIDFKENGEPFFKRNENDTLEYEVIIIDEASMLAVNLFESLLKAIRQGSRLLLIGDSSQLPSVGAGNVLGDVIASGKFCTVCLTEIFRQAKESLIVTNAHAINGGDFPELSVRDKDFFMLERKSDYQIAETVADLCATRLPKTYGEMLARGIQVISPTRNGPAGTENLNVILQEKLNPPSEDKNEKKAHGVVFREGDKVMQIKNNYDIEWEREDSWGQGIFNGDIGVIEKIDNPSETMLISFDGRKAEYEFSMLDDLEHSFAITVHKSQGSEYPIVVIPLCRTAPMLLTRNMLYTAVTRAQRIVILVGTQATVSEMVNNNRQIKRYTGLSQILCEI